MKTAYLSGVSTLKFNSQKCINCAMCLDVCPHGVFELNAGHIEIKAIDNCIECGACMQNCIAGALSVKSGVGCAFAMINGIMTKGNADLGTCDCSSDSGTCC